MSCAEYADWPTCNADATRRLMRGIDVTRDWLYAGRRATEVDRAVKRDPRVREAWDVWSRCVAAQGFARYPGPAAAYTDDAWQRDSDGNTRHSQRERATAVADVTCKRRHRTVELWHAVRARRCGRTGPTSPRCCGSSARVRGLKWLPCPLIDGLLGPQWNVPRTGHRRGEIA
ncbi:hypothetical protein BJY54_000416 [Streptomyces nodosus]|nr:hypothetical protein [Streptomyces nodosus]